MAAGPAQAITEIRRLFAERGDSAYGGEAVSQREHALQAAHFARQASPLSREHIAMSLFSIAVVVLLFVRHRGNLARIWAGT